MWHISRHQKRWIIVAAMCCLLGALLADATEQVAKTQLASVTVVGRESGSILLPEGGKKQRYIIVELDSKARVLVATEQNAAELNEALLDEHRRLTANFMDMSKDLIAKQDQAGLKKVEEVYKAASDELLQHVGYCVAEGTLTQVGTDLRMQGKLRPYAYKGADKALAKGKVMIQGELVRLQGNDKKSILAIRNGEQTILVVGKAAEGPAKIEGVVRVFGVLRGGDVGGSPVIEAERIEK